ncbi:hypothetical protein [Dinghuibacter silviterrae]|uniref:Amidophosphoribosyltransferase n=1 Tax=Dinghuibacter silviterrae TaxID=1539049 RepID=A0A4R8DNH2_9BACT|nr:hypothetical protein [Dinghuibacter silviterrae]TDW99589.1 hypothetical protein EDB95_0599 [Dinghuibacter silviterrae]
MGNLIRIDEAALHDQQHWSLGATDECYYLMEYTARGQGNGLIHNLKMPVDSRSPWELCWKEAAIEEAACLLRPALCALIDFGNTTIVPVPPSKVRTSPLYDDRILRILKKACPLEADIREIIIARSDMPASHENAVRPSAIHIRNNYTLDPAVSSALQETVVIFDDILTAGNHFSACKRFLREHCGPRRYVGVFLARRVFL